MTSQPKASPEENRCVRCGVEFENHPVAGVNLHDFVPAGSSAAKRIDIMKRQPASPEDLARAEKVAGPHEGHPRQYDAGCASVSGGACDCPRRERVLAIAAEFEKVRAEAHKQAAEDVCMYCGGRARQYNRTSIGPNKAGNWTHLHLSGNPKEQERCIASSIWARRHFGRESPHAELLPPLRAEAEKQRDKEWTASVFGLAIPAMTPVEAERARDIEDRVRASAPEKAGDALAERVRVLERLLREGVGLHRESCMVPYGCTFADRAEALLSRASEPGEIGHRFLPCLTLCGPCDERLPVGACHMPGCARPESEHASEPEKEGK